MICDILCNYILINCAWNLQEKALSTKKFQEFDEYGLVS